MIRNDIRFLGVDGSKSQKSGGTCVQAGREVIIDAGNILQSLGDEAAKIRHVFLTHSHLDHINDLPYLIEAFFDRREEPLKIYALAETIRTLRSSLFNWEIWPDFEKISLLNAPQKSAIEFIPLIPGQTYSFDDVSLTPVMLNHTVPTSGYIIQKGSYKTLYATDTYLSESIKEALEDDYEITSLIIDCSFPSSMKTLAKKTKHLTPLLIRQLLKAIDREIELYITHIKPQYREEVVSELKQMDLFKSGGRVVENMEYLYHEGFGTYESDHAHIIKLLAKEKDIDQIFKTILLEAMKYTKSEGGTIYLKEKDALKFKVVVNQELGIFESDIDWPKVPLYIDGSPNRSNVSALCALEKRVIHIEDVYHESGYDFSGMKAFDAKNGYRSQSMLVIPMLDHEENLIGVLQLINKRSGMKISSYQPGEIETTLAYAAYAAVALTKMRLVEDMEELLLSFMRSIAYAIGEKSAYGYAHINRVSDLMDMIARSVHRDNEQYGDISYSRDEFKELRIAALVHDIGKIAIPDYILDKGTKLQTLHDRIGEIRERFLNAIHQQKIELLELECATLKGEVELEMVPIRESYQKSIEQLIDDLEFVERVNQPVGYLSDGDLKRIRQIGQKYYVLKDQKVYLLSEDEMENLSIRVGSLNEKEKEIVNAHAKIGYEMLRKLNFPQKFQRVPLIAGFHHEKLNGKGYPMGLTEEQIPLEVRMLTIADIFEALTAIDRPYKRGKSVEDAIEILEKMAKNGEIDADLVHFLKANGIFHRYEKRFLSNCENRLQRLLSPERVDG
ncbi:MAG: hypothetical protein B6D59_04065 [Campylobacteraceae bacterium 4484_4]|nr:MAG: hypothetical protein B6D59_04065 [Campylobacteraceae bacterium 4484_4]